MDKKQYLKEFNQSLNLVRKSVPKLPNRNALNTIKIKSHKIRGNATNIEHRFAEQLSSIIESTSSNNLRTNEEIKENFSEIIKHLECSIEDFENEKTSKLSKKNKKKLNVFCEKYCPDIKMD